jgi:hypothetical protein
MDVYASDIPWLVGDLDANVDELPDDVGIRHRMPGERQRRERSAVTKCQQGYAALQQWVAEDNAYQAKVTLAKQNHKSAKDIKAIQGPGPRPPAPPMCQPPTAFGIAPGALVPSAGAS